MIASWHVSGFVAPSSLRAYSPKSIDNWKMAHTLNCSGDAWRKKYTVLIPTDWFCVVIRNWTVRLTWTYLPLPSLLESRAETHTETVAYSYWWTRIVRGEPFDVKLSTHLINCGIGRVLSSPNATNPSIETNISERPNIRKRMAWQRLR